MGLDKDNNKQTIIISDAEQEKKPWAASWPAFGHYLNKYKYWVLGTSIILGLVGFAGVKFVYNPSKETFKIGFAYNKSNFISKINSRNEVAYYYSNGSPFDYQYVISLNNMKSVVDASNKKAQDDYLKNNPTATKEEVENVKGEFASINYEEINKSNLLTITEINDNSFIDTSSYLAFDINGHNKDFSSDKLAQSFCMALVKGAQIGQNSSGDFNASTNLDGFYEISSPFNKLDTQITMLQDEVDFLFSSYQSLINIFGGNTEVITTGSSNKTSLSNAFRQFKNALGISISAEDANMSSISSLNNSLTFDVDNTTYKYVYVDTTSSKELYLSYYSNKKKSIQTSIEDLKNKLSSEQENYNDLSDKLQSNEISSEERNMLKSALNNSFKNINNYNNQISEYTMELSKIPYQENFINSITDWSSWKSSNAVIADTEIFKNYMKVLDSINTLYNTLEKQAGIFKNVYESACQEISTASNNNVKTLYRNVMQTSGSKSWVLGAGGGVVLGFLASTLIAFGIGQYERRKAILLGEPDPIIPVKKEEMAKEESVEEEKSEDKTSDDKKEEDKAE